MIPAASRSVHDPEQLRVALSAETVVKKLEQSDTYTVDVTCEMDGLEAASAIRALNRPDAGRIPIIALTANAFDEDVQRSLQAGMTAHLSKPVEPAHLYETLEALFW